MDSTVGEGPEKMGHKYQWTMSPWTSGCIAVGGIVSNSLSTYLTFDNFKFGIRKLFS